MKKEYIKPESSLMEVEVMTMLAGSPSDIPVSGEHGDELSNDRRGTWGDLWQ